MPDNNRENARRPFHETIVDAIQCSTKSEVGCLANLILVTKIPKGHDRIIKAIDICWGKWTKTTPNWAVVITGLKTGILEQKAEAEAYAAKKAELDFHDFIQSDDPRSF